MGLETFCGSLRGQYFIFGALCPSKSGLLSNEQTYRETYRGTAASYLGIGTLQFSRSLRVNDALYPSKSGLINKHTVKHTVAGQIIRHNVNKQTNKHIVKHITRI